MSLRTLLALIEAKDVSISRARIYVNADCSTWTAEYLMLRILHLEVLISVTLLGTCVTVRNNGHSEEPTHLDKRWQKLREYERHTLRFPSQPVQFIPSGANISESTIILQ